MLSLDIENFILVGGLTNNLAKAMESESMNATAIARFASVADAITSIALDIPNVDLREIVGLDSHAYRLLLVKQIMEHHGYHNVHDHLLQGLSHQQISDPLFRHELLQ